jgi:catechol 2,3-dioxygenase-like lactoylglutathione lyase family enzyme
MNPKPFVITLWAEDVARTAHFYRDAIGLPLASPAAHHGHPHFDLDGIYLTIRKGKPMVAAESRFPCTAFSVDDLDAAIHRLQSHQVKLPFGIEEDGDNRWVMIYDPSGNLIELAEAKKG